jgi:hypothetical protein
LLALSLNIVVGYAGLLDLGYVAFCSVARIWQRYQFRRIYTFKRFPELAPYFPMVKKLCPSTSRDSAGGWVGCFGIMLGASTRKGALSGDCDVGFQRIIQRFGPTGSMHQTSNPDPRKASARLAPASSFVVLTSVWTTSF